MRERRETGGAFTYTSRIHIHVSIYIGNTCVCISYGPRLPVYSLWPPIAYVFLMNPDRVRISYGPLSRMYFLWPPIACLFLMDPDHVCISNGSDRAYMVCLRIDLPICLCVHVGSMRVGEMVFGIIFIRLHPEHRGNSYKCKI